MKTENLFKFVAIRVARSQQSHATPTLSVPNTDDAFVELIARRTSSTVPLDRARREVAAELMASSIYWSRNPDWRAFLPLEAVLRRLLGQANDADELWDLIDQLFRARLGADFGLERFVGGEQFARMKQALWRSYYSNLMLLDRRGQDRTSMVFWIRLFHWLENAENSDVAEQLFEQFEQLRPTVPSVLVRMEREKAEPEVPEDDADDPEKIRAKSIVAAKQRIQSLKTARAKVRQVFDAKLVAFETNPPKVPPPHNADEDVGEEVPPWKLKAEELDYETNATLKAHGITLELHDAPHIETLLDQRIARERSALRELQSVEDITFVKGVPVKVRRRVGESA